MSKLKSMIMIIDPQQDFCDPNGGSLVVPGAMQDIHRLAELISRKGKQFDITVTLDSHQGIGIERTPGYWVRESDRSEADPFTVLGIHPDGRRVVAYKGDSPTEDVFTTRIPHFLHHGGPLLEGTGPAYRVADYSVARTTKSKHQDGGAGGNWVAPLERVEPCPLSPRLSPRVGGSALQSRQALPLYSSFSSPTTKIGIKLPLQQYQLGDHP
jgi:hypothetical protein